MQGASENWGLLSCLGSRCDLRYTVVDRAEEHILVYRMDEELTGPVLLTSGVAWWHHRSMRHLLHCN